MEATAATEEAGSTGLRVGFLGCGVIASSIARGLAGAAIESGNNAFGIESILLSRRSESRSGPLAEELAEKSNGAFGVSIAGDDNQEILDGSDLVFLTVLPQQASAVLESLEFDPERHVLVSLVSTAKLEDLVRDSKLAPSRVSKMICLPSIAQHRGVALLCCGSDGGDGGGSSTQTNTRAFLTGLFGATGGCVALDTEADLEACMVTTCTMGPLYGTMKKQRDWLLATCTGSLSREDATFLVIKQFAGAVAEAETATTKSESGENDERGHESSSGLSNKLEELIAEQTPGGLNEQALRNYGEVLGGFEDLQQPVMDAILSRIRGETDGSLGAS